MALHLVILNKWVLSSSVFITKNCFLILWYDWECIVLVLLIQHSESPDLFKARYESSGILEWNVSFNMAQIVNRLMK